MKNLKAAVLLVLAVAIGLAAAFYAAAWTSQRANIASDKVAIAAVDIEPGSKLTPQMLTTIDWPSGALPQGVIHDMKTLEDRVVKVGILRGEAILDGKLAPVGTQGGLSAIITDGKRAMTVRVNDVVGVAGFALPGTYVDVMVNALTDKDSKTGEGRQMSKTVLEHVLVLAVAQEASRDDSKPKVVSAVTLELSLEDSEKLDLARSVGTLSLVLRNQVDKRTVATSGITKNQLFGESEPIATKQPASIKQIVSVRPLRIAPLQQRPTNCVEIVQSGVKTLNCFE
jgi:pilus assembly protein CpaB